MIQHTSAEKLPIKSVLYFACQMLCPLNIKNETLIFKLSVSLQVSYKDFTLPGSAYCSNSDIL